MTSTPPGALADSSYIAQDLVTSLARPKNQRHQLKKPTIPSSLRNAMTRSTSSTSVGASTGDESSAEEEPSTVKPATRTIHHQTTAPQSKLPAKLIPDSLMLDARKSSSNNTQAMEAEVKRLQDAFDASRSSLSVKDAEIAQLKDKLAKQSKKAAAPAPKTPAIGDAEFKALEQQFAQQERLLSGYQKENERATAELQHLRSRNKVMEAHLERVHGIDDWESVVFSESSPGMVKRTNSSPVVQRVRKVFEGSPTESPATPSAAEFPLLPAAGPGPSEADLTGLLAHIQSVHLLVKAMDQRLKDSEAELDCKERTVLQQASEARAMLIAAA